jgi:hypothetical protein
MSRTDKDGPHHPRTGLRALVGGGGPPRWFIHADWTDPDRQAVRRACEMARQEHRGNGEVDADPPTHAHRQCAQWHWW